MLSLEPLPTEAHLRGAVGPDGLEHRAEEIHAMALSDLHGEFATVVDTAAVIAALQVPSSARSTS